MTARKRPHGSTHAGWLRGPQTTNVMKMMIVEAEVCNSSGGIIASKGMVLLPSGQSNDSRGHEISAFASPGKPQAGCCRSGGLLARRFAYSLTFISDVEGDAGTGAGRDGATAAGQGPHGSFAC